MPIETMKKVAYDFAKKMIEDNKSLLDNNITNNTREWYLIVTFANAYYNYLLGKWTKEKAVKCIDYYITTANNYLNVFE